MHFSVQWVLIIIKNSGEHKDSPGNSPCIMILRLKVHTELLVIALAMPKKWKLNIINGIVHTGLSKILSNSYASGKKQIFAKDFTKEWVGYAISLASIAIAKESLLYRYRLRSVWMDPKAY